MKKIMRIFIANILILNGCMALDGPLGYHYVPTFSDGVPVPIRVVMEKFHDERPLPSHKTKVGNNNWTSISDRENTERIEPVDEQVTVAVLEDFRTSRLFESIEPYNAGGHSFIILRGTVRRFTWEETNIGWVPAIGWLMGIVGAPIHFTSATAALDVELFNPDSKKIIAQYNKQQEVKDSFSMYYGPTESGAELAQALKSVSDQIKMAIRADYAAGKFNNP